MQAKRKLLPILLVVIVAAVVFAACGGAADNAAPLQDFHAQACFGEIGRRRQPIMASADDDCVAGWCAGGRHGGGNRRGGFGHDGVSGLVSEVNGQADRRGAAQAMLRPQIASRRTLTFRRREREA